jgi:hypothetical protein
MKPLITITFALHFFAAALCHAEYHTNTITTPGGDYAFRVDGGNTLNPTIELIAGVTNILNIQTVDFHPVQVTVEPFTFSSWFSGADPKSAAHNQPIALTTASSGFPTTLYYVCAYHGFYGQIHFTAPASPVPPQNTLLQIRVGTNIVMTSTGTNTTWLLVPEFSSNLLSGSWSSVPSYTNRFANGTNTTTFNRLEAICGSNVFLRLRQQEN